jgi:ABC-type Fe3+-siderophore transport system permease subunit
MPIVIAGIGSLAGLGSVVASLAIGLPIWAMAFLFPIVAAIGSLLVAVGVYVCRLKRE